MDRTTFFFVFIVIGGLIAFLIGFVAATTAMMRDRIEPEETPGGGH